MQMPPSKNNAKKEGGRAKKAENEVGRARHLRCSRRRLALRTPCPSDADAGRRRRLRRLRTPRKPRRPTLGKTEVRLHSQLVTEGLELTCKPRGPARPKQQLQSKPRLVSPPLCPSQVRTRHSPPARKKAEREALLAAEEAGTTTKKAAPKAGQKKKDKGVTLPPGGIIASSFSTGDDLGVRKTKGADGEPEKVTELSATGIEGMIEALELVNQRTDKDAVGAKVSSVLMVICGFFHGPSVYDLGSSGWTL